MRIKLNADQVFEIADQIERNGAAFYCKAAESERDEETRSVLLNLASVETEHQRTFSRMRESLRDDERKSWLADPDEHLAFYLQAFASGHVFDMHADPTQFLVGKRSMREIIEKAIQLEKDSVLFYVGMREVVPERLGRGRVDDIIKQEMSHIARLRRRLDRHAS